MNLLRALPLILILLTGCPAPPPPGPGPGGTPPAGGTPTQPADDGKGPAAGGQDGGGENGGDDAAPAGGSADDWTIVPKDVHEIIYPTLQPASTWPDPAGLKAVSDNTQLPKGKALQLKQLVESLVAKDLQPNDPDAALGLDAQGRLFMRLGKTKTVGSASMDVVPKGSDFPLFAIALDNAGEGPRSLATLKKRVKDALTKDLGDELGTKDHGLEAHPKVKGGERIAALAFLDRQGFGMQFPYLYAYGSADRLLIVLQEVPHMSSPDDK